MKNQSGQVLILIAVLLVVVLMIMAVIIESGMLLIERQELNRASSAGGKAGLILVGDLMVTRVSKTYQDNSLVRGTIAPDPTFTPGSAPLESEQEHLEESLTDHDRAFLTSSPVKTQVTWEVREHLSFIGYPVGKEESLSIEVIYPFDYHLEDENLEILVRISKNAPVLFSGFLPMENGVITGESRQSILQR